MFLELPRVTILIANHNYGKYLKDAVDSAIAQQYDPNKLSIMIVDDASTDNSWEVLHKEYFRKIPHENRDQFLFKTKVGKFDSGIKITAIKCPESKGPSHARNLGIKTSFNDTDIYAILDADDIYYKTKVFTCIKPITIDPERIGVVYADYDILNVETGNTIREFKQPYDKWVLSQECIVHSGAIINKAALQHTCERSGFYDEGMRCCEDFDLWLRISDKFMIVHVPESLSLVRVHKENATFSIKNEVWQQNWRRVQEKAIARQNGGS